MKIGILSDTHHRTTLHKEAISHLLKEGAEYLLHAGDIGSKEHIQMLKIRPYAVVFGNNDNHLMPLNSTHNIFKEPHYLKIEDIKIKIMHLPYFMTPDADLIISGHTHQFEAKSINGKLFLNPGEVCAREKNLSECVVLEITDKQWIVNRFYRKTEDINWQVKKIILERAL